MNLKQTDLNKIYEDVCSLIDEVENIKQTDLNKIYEDVCSLVDEVENIKGQLDSAEQSLSDMAYWLQERGAK